MHISILIGSLVVNQHFHATFYFFPSNPVQSTLTKNGHLLSFPQSLRARLGLYGRNFRCSRCSCIQKSSNFVVAIREERASSDHSSDPRSSFLGNLSELSQESGDLEA